MSQVENNAKKDTTPSKNDAVRREIYASDPLLKEIGSLLKSIDPDSAFLKKYETV